MRSAAATASSTVVDRLARRHRDAVAREQLLALVLEQVHGYLLGVDGRRRRRRRGELAGGQPVSCASRSSSAVSSHSVIVGQRRARGEDRGDADLLERGDVGVGDDPAAEHERRRRARARAAARRSAGTASCARPRAATARRRRRPPAARSRRPAPGVWKQAGVDDLEAASRSARAITLAPRSWPSRPGLAMTTRYRRCIRPKPYPSGFGASGQRRRARPTAPGWTRRRIALARSAPWQPAGATPGVAESLATLAVLVARAPHRRRPSSSSPAGPRPRDQGPDPRSASAKSLQDKAKDGGPFAFAGTTGDTGFWVAIEDGKLVALKIRKPGTADCNVIWRGSQGQRSWTATASRSGWTSSPATGPRSRSRGDNKGQLPGRPQRHHPAPRPGSLRRPGHNAR